MRLWLGRWVKLIEREEKRGGEGEREGEGEGREGTWSRHITHGKMKYRGSTSGAVMRERKLARMRIRRKDVDGEVVSGFVSAVGALRFGGAGDFFVFELLFSGVAFVGDGVGEDVDGPASVR